MGAAIIPFDFETNAVRVVMIAEAPWFVAVDVCRVLDHSNPTVALARLDDDEKQRIDPKVLLGSSVAGGGAQMMNIVSESGLYALILTSNKPAAKRFRKWVTAEVLPAIRRNGAYFQPSVDQTLLAVKRAYYAALPEVHKGKADVRAEALAQVEHLIAEGMRASHAVAAVAEDFGMGVRTLYAHRRAVYMVPQSDWGAAMAPRWNGPRGMLAECHPEALRLFIDLRLSGAKVSDCYRRMVDEAHVRGWAPIATERTMYRMAERLSPRLPRPPQTKKEAA